MSQHIVEKKTYFKVFGGLMILLAATIGVAYIGLGAFNILAALTIACGKALLIIMYFMHARYGPRLIWVFAGAAFFWLGILFVFSFSDYLWRFHG